MNLTAKWGRWGAWYALDGGKHRYRDLKLAGVSVARLYQMRIPTPTRFFQRTGTYLGLRIGNEQTTPYFRTKRAALERLA